MRPSSSIEMTASSFEDLPHTLVVREAASLLSVTRATVHLWVQRGDLPARQAGSVWLIEKREIEVLARRRGIVLHFVKSERGF